MSDNSLEDAPKPHATAPEMTRERARSERRDLDMERGEPVQERVKLKAAIDQLITLGKQLEIPVFVQRGGEARSYDVLARLRESELLGVIEK